MLRLNRISLLVASTAIAGLALAGCDSTSTTTKAATTTTDTASGSDTAAGADTTAASDTATNSDTASTTDTGGGADVAVAPKTIVEIAISDPQFSTLVAAASAAGLAETLSSKGPFTVFAPTNDAFAKVPKADLDALLKDKAKLAAILTHHVIAGKVEAKDVKGGIVTMVDGTDEQITVGKDGVMLGKAKVIKTDIQASNGVIHVIDTVILPPADIVDTAVGAGSFKTLAAALTAADLITTLKGKGPFTVFAPNDAAFAKIAAADLDAVLKDKALLTSILTYHVVAGKVYAKDVKAGMVKTVNGAELTIKADEMGVMVDGAKVIATDIISSNGVIHIIDSVVMPPKKTIVEIAISAPQFSTLVAAASAAGLAETLSSKGPFTVFAPTNDAFAKVPKAELDALLKDKAKLAAILTHHVIAGKVEAKDVKTGIVAMVDGTDEQITVGKDGVMLGKAKVIKTDIQASNGVIHVIDTVILPPADIVDTAVGAGSFKTLAAALTAADLITTLKGKGPFTVFAPNDAAFAKIPAADLDALLKNKALLTSILTYHVVAGKVYAKDVKAGKVKTVNGAELTIKADEMGVMVDGAKVIATDIISSNGVIHVIDSVVMPPK